MKGGVADWGYGHWLLNLYDPLPLVFMMLEANVMAVEHQTHSMLGPRYCRLNPILHHALDVRTGEDIQPALQTVMAEESTQVQLAATAKWIKAFRW